MELFYMLLGGFMIYSVIHFFLIQNKKTWENRTGYEQFISVFAQVSISLIFLTVMFG